MQIWAVTTVKDELDILPYTLAHLTHEGLDGIVVADNMSSDGTWAWLARWHAPGVQTHVMRDPEPAHYQGRKMTELAHYAFELGADWVIPFDADELWHAPEGLRALLTAADADVVRAAVYNYHPTSTDDPNEANPYRRITHRTAGPLPLAKVAIRRGPVTLIDGNHGAIGAGLHCIDSELKVAHFPWRSWEQFHRKVRNGAAALAATDLAPEIGAHWREYGRHLDVNGEAGLREIYETWFHDPSDPLEVAPAPWAV